jgi:hypothetical protein
VVSCGGRYDRNLKEATVLRDGKEPCEEIPVIPIARTQLNAMRRRSTLCGLFDQLGHAFDADPIVKTETGANMDCDAFGQSPSQSPNWTGRVIFRPSADLVRRVRLRQRELNSP